MTECVSYSCIDLLSSPPAVQGADFLFTSASSSFPPTSSTSTSQCHQVTILDDAVLENTEHLEAELTAPGGIARVSIGTSVVRAAIIDDDSVIVGFSQTDFTVDEDEPQELSVRVCVEMTGEIEREVSVSVASEHGSADGECENAKLEPHSSESFLLLLHQVQTLLLLVKSSPFLPDQISRGDNVSMCMCWRTGLLRNLRPFFLSSRPTVSELSLSLAGPCSP